MRHEDIRPGFGHEGGLFRVKDIGRGEQVQLIGLAHELDLEPVAHAGLLEVLSELAIIEPDGGEVLDSGEAHLLQLWEKDVHDPEGVGSTNPGQHRSVFHNRQHLAGHIHHDGVGVSVGKQPGQRAPSCHSKASGVVDDDQVHAALFTELGGDAGACARADNRDLLFDLRAEPPEYFTAFDSHGIVSRLLLRS